VNITRAPQVFLVIVCGGCHAALSVCDCIIHMYYTFMHYVTFMYAVALYACILRMH
jgi:hypothetical protein